MAGARGGGVGSGGKDAVRVGKRVAIYSALSVLAGIVGGLVGMRWFEAPFYFGFFFAFVLAGMTGLFALAAHIEGSQGHR